MLVRAEQGIRFSNLARGPGDRLPEDDLMDFILSDGVVDVTTPPRTSSSARVTPPTSPDQGDSPETSIKSILSKLIDDVKILQSGKQNSSIKFASLGFSDLHECGQWIDLHLSGFQYDLFMDPLLMLDRVYGDDEVGEGGAGPLKVMELQFKMRIESGNEASALNALRFARPRVFHKGRPTIVSVQNKFHLSLLPSHAEWNPGGEGIMDFCINKINLLEDVISDEISHTTFQIETTAHFVASKCLSATVSFLTQLFGAIESIYKRLFHYSKFTTEQAWTLTTQVLDRILADLYVPKDNAVQSLKTRDNRSKCAQVLFSAVKTHDVMSGYVAHKFENHPSVSTEYVKFLATNSGSEKVTKLAEVVDVLKTKTSVASDEAKAATKKADVASSKISDLMKEIATLTEKVKSLEARK